MDAPPSSPFVPVHYPPTVEAAISMVEKAVIPLVAQNQSTRWLSLKLLEQDELMLNEILRHLGTHFMEDHTLKATLNNALLFLHSHHIDTEKLKDVMVSTLFSTAENIASGTVSYDNRDTYDATDRKLDRILTGKITGPPIMFCLLTLIFWLTIAGANYPSDFLTGFFLKVQLQLTALFHYLHAPDWLHGALIVGVYRVLTRVISVMLPPMAIFFPLFTLLEDTGYLPRIAFNLDKPFQRCSACGKQALTMCMGFGCNAVGVVGCRIIDSPRERLLAILTNNFVPCNGRFPTLIALLGMFLIGNHCGTFSSLLSALALSGIILLGIFITFLITKLLSVTLLCGVPSSFTLELPPYRRPQTGKVVVRSFFDRTLFVLDRAVIVSAPAGLVLWLMANLSVNGSSILNHCSDFLHPFATLMGLDGVILLAFILGFPANEIVIPIIIMAYTSQGSLQDFDSLSQTRELLILNGWSWKTAVSTMLFSLFHFPCSTTLLTIKKETGSMKWTALAAILPTSVGILLCMLFTFLSNLLV